MRLSKGFTLIELLVTLTLAGILLMAGIPGLQSLQANMSISQHRDQLVNSIAYARSEAVARLENVSVASLSGTTTWSTGWQVFIDDDGDCTVDAGDELLRETDNSGANIGIAVTTNAINCIAFNSYGENVLATERVFDITKTNGTTQQVTVSNIGYVSIN